MFNLGLSRSGIAPVTSDQLRQLLNRHDLTTGDALIRVALEQALNRTFWAVLVLSFGTVLLALLVPPISIAPAALKSASMPQPD